VDCRYRGDGNKVFYLYPVMSLPQAGPERGFPGRGPMYFIEVVLGSKFKPLTVLGETVGLTFRQNLRTMCPRFK